MAEETIKTQAIRNYLLGRVSEPEAEKIEGMYFVAPQGVDEVWGTFGDLAEEYLTGALPEVESRLFEERLRTSPSFREIFETEKALYKYSANITNGLSAQDKPRSVAAETEGRTPFPGLAFVKTWRLAFAGLFVLFALLTWFALKSGGRLHPFSPLSSKQIKTPGQISPDKITPAPKPPQGTPQLEGSTNDTLADRVKPSKPGTGDKKSDITATFIFTAAAVREGQPALIMKIPPQTNFLKLEFELSSDDCPVITAILEAESGQQIQRWEKLSPGHEQSTPSVSLSLRADTLNNGAYVVKLECDSGRENPTFDQQFRFRVEK